MVHASGLHPGRSFHHGLVPRPVKLTLQQTSQSSLKPVAHPLDTTAPLALREHAWGREIWSGRSQFTYILDESMWRSCSKRGVSYTGASEGYFRQVQAAVRTITHYSMGV